MTPEQKKEIIRMRKSGLGYSKIADLLGISLNTVKSFCRRNDITIELRTIPETKFTKKQTIKVCQNCGKPVIQNAGRKEKKFCSDSCRIHWWINHLSLENQKATYEYTCPVCGKAFYSYGNRNRKYCSHECYIKGRFGSTS